MRAPCLSGTTGTLSLSHHARVVKPSSTAATTSALRSKARRVEAILPEYWRAKNTLQRGRVASKAEVIGDETWLGTSVRYGRSANTA